MFFCTVFFLLASAHALALPTSTSTTTIPLPLHSSIKDRTQTDTMTKTNAGLPYVGGGPDNVPVYKNPSAIDQTVAACFHHLQPRSYNSGTISLSPVAPKDENITQFKTSLDLIGNTPLVDITSICSPKNPATRILGKAEFLNPGYSMKDRIVSNIFKKATEAGVLQKGMTVVAASSGNTGCSVAMLCAMRGYKAVILTDSKCSEEKKAAIRLYGAKLIIAKKGECYMKMEADLALENPDWFSVDQYNNLANPEGHYKSTGPEIFSQSNGEITHFVAAGSTGGTISGTGAFLKEQNPAIKVILADPSGSVFKPYFQTGELKKGTPFLVEGVGKANIPGAMDFGVVDGTVEVHDRETMRMCHKMAKTTGLCVGGSSGLNCVAAAKIAETSEEPAIIVTMLCDSGVKYLSKVFSDKWLNENHMTEGTEKWREEFSI